MKGTKNYKLFLKFLKSYKRQGYKDISATDPLMLELERMMEKNDQFLYVADLIQMEILFTSKRSEHMIGVAPEDISPYIFMEATHPDDIQRLNVGRTKLVKLAQDIFIAEEGSKLLSTNFRIRNAEGKYSNFLIQAYLFYAERPYKTTYFFKLHTNIDWCKKIKHGYHYYVGDDMSNFRYPDKELLSKGNVFSKREFEIIKLIASGQRSEQIAKQLFLSIYTVNTHRGNILKKTGKTNIPDLIFDLQERGLL